MIPSHGRQHRLVVDESAQAGQAEFGFDFAPMARPLLAVLGIRPATAHVRVDADRLEVSFGRWRVLTGIANVVSAQSSGPLSWWRAVGVRLSLADRGLTFGTGTRGGVCIRFARPVRGMDPFGLLRHPGLTVTVTEPELLMARLHAADVEPPPTDKKRASPS